MDLPNGAVRVDARARREVRVDPSRITSVAEARRLAARVLPRALFDYIDGAADDELTMVRNEEAFRRVSFRPRMATATSEPRLGVELLGRTLSLPVLLAPCGLAVAVHPDGPGGVARAARARGTVSVLSAVAGVSPEQVGAALGGGERPLWYQLYAPGGRAEWEPLVDRVAAAGYEALMVTVDTPALGNRERDRRNGISGSMHASVRGAALLAAQVAARPGWAARMGRALVASRRQGTDGPTVGLVAAGGSPFTWDDVAALAERWDGPVVVKGILSGPDARRALDAGAAAVVVSNHGGRQLDGAPATLDVLPEVVAEVAGAMPVLLDSGVRRGGDVAKAMALGAAAVLVGRPYLYALAVAGQAGVERLVGLFRSDLVRTLVLLGCPGVDALGPEWVTVAPEGSGTVRR
ncbi:MAG: alpha-hydroxy acid oxidase [Actinomycetota bacterium]|jgi:isopentenyl diphosphate isomerase/L-lactate dehydrogenase-like FMN-dependent dehydrogenase|nr:alpha-hydroxy acid oxidase [Actinomycetota bacterium]